MVALANDAYNRPAVMWSPWATGPDEPVEQVWIGIVWRLLVGRDVGAGIEIIGKGEGKGGGEASGLASRLEDLGKKEEEKGEVCLTGANFAALSGREEMTEDRLRTGQNRYLWHRAYASRARGGF